jgi:hypothetical protein
MQISGQLVQVAGCLGQQGDQVEVIGGCGVGG